jgi:hypothetical protein
MVSQIHDEERGEWVLETPELQSKYYDSVKSVRINKDFEFLTTEYNGLPLASTVWTFENN